MTEKDEENAENLEYMRDKVRNLSRGVLEGLLLEVVEALYPGGDVDHEWSPDTLQDVVSALARRHIQPWSKKEEL